MVVHELAQKRHGLARDADEAAPDAPLLDEPRGHPARGVARYREADALRGADDGRVDADDLAARVDKRSPGIAGIERGVGLDHVVDEPPGGAAQRAAEPAHDPRGRRLLEAHGGADRNGNLSQPHGAAVGEDKVRDLVGAHAKNRKIAVRVVAHQVRGETPAVGQEHARRASAMHDVAVGQQVPIGRYEESGPCARRRPRGADLDVDDRGARRGNRGRDGARIGIQQGLIGLPGSELLQW
jgi:hypothetical protein